MYNQFGNPYIVYDMHESWINSQLRKRKVHKTRTALLWFSEQAAQAMISLGQQLKVWGESLQSTPQQQNTQLT